MNHVDRRLLPPIFILNIGHNQSASRIVALTFLTENVSNESAFFVQRAHLYQAFLRNHTRTKFTAPTELLRSSYGSYGSYGAPTASGSSPILVLEPTEQSTDALNYRAVPIFLLSCQLVLITTEQSIIGSLYQLNIQAVLSQFEYSQPQDIFENHLSTRTQQIGQHLHGFSYLRVILFIVTCILSNGVNSPV